MTSFGPGIAQSVAGMNQAERVAARDLDRSRRDPKSVDPKRSEDLLDLEVQGTEAVDAVRSLKDNTQEEAAEDRQKQAGYGPDPGQAGQLDLEA